MESQFGIKIHAMIQVIEGREWEFQPEHLFCEKCWESVDAAFSHAGIYGSCRSTIIHDGIDENHSISVTKRKKV